jgi:hypothetical protein
MSPWTVSSASALRDFDALGRAGRQSEHRARRPGRRARVYYASHIEVLEPDHPERRFVAALCLYSHAIDTREAGRAEYDQQAAERFARALRMPADTFDASCVDRTSSSPNALSRCSTT